MTFPTLSEVVEDVITEIGLVGGTAVQTYTEPQIILAANRMFNFLCEKAHWDWLCEWGTYTLNGTTGVVNTSFDATIQGYDDLLVIRRASSHRKIPLSVNGDHLRVTTGAEPVYHIPIRWNHDDAAKLIRFYPLTATGDVEIRAMHRPAEFSGNDDIVPFNRNVIVLGTAWYTLAGDGINPGNADKLQGMFDIAYQDFITKINTVDLGVGRNWRDHDSFTVS